MTPIVKLIMEGRTGLYGMMSLSRWIDVLDAFWGEPGNPVDDVLGTGAAVDDLELQLDHIGAVVGHLPRPESALGLLAERGYTMMRTFDSTVLSHELRIRMIGIRSRAREGREADLEIFMPKGNESVDSGALAARRIRNFANLGRAIHVAFRAPTRWQYEAARDVAESRGYLLGTCGTNRSEQCALSFLDACGSVPRIELITYEGP